MPIETPNEATSTSRPSSALWVALALLWLGMAGLFFALHDYFGESSDFPPALQGFIDFTHAHNLWKSLFPAISGYDANSPRYDLALLLPGLFLPYVYALRLLRSGRGTRLPLSRIMAICAALCLPLLLLPNLLSSDVYLYTFFGRIAVVYHADPSLVPPSAFPNDAFTHHLSPYWMHKPQVYGPLWSLTESGIAVLAEFLGGPAWYLLLFRLLGLALHLICCALIWRILGEWKPERQVWGTVLYAWNPLALIESVGSVHNDVMMAAFMLAGLLLALRRHPAPAIVLLMCAAMVKFLALILLPLYAIALLRNAPNGQRGRLAASIVGLSLGTVGLLASLVGKQSVLNVLKPPMAGMSVNSFGTAIVHLAAPMGRAAQVRALAGGEMAAMLVLGLGCLAGAIAIWRKPQLETVIACASFIFLVTLCATTWFWPWYVLWPLSLAALLPGRAAWPAVLLSATATLAYAQLPQTVLPFLMFIPVLAALVYVAATVPVPATEAKLGAMPPETL